MTTTRALRPVRYLTTAETAKLLRQALKERFPTTRFSVRSKTYSGGSSIDIEWTDGPTTTAVDALKAHFEGATFDGMIDLKSYLPAVAHNGEVVKMGADFIFTHRRYTGPFLSRVVAEVGTRYHAPRESWPAVNPDTYFGAQLADGADRTSPLANCTDERWWTWQCVVRRAAEDRTSLQ